MEQTKDFFNKLNIDIETLPPGELSTMLLISTALDCTISILDEGLRYKTVLSTASQPDPIRPHVVLLRVGLLQAKKPTATGAVRAFTTFHFHGVRSVNSVLVCQTLYWCHICGTAIPSNSRQAHLKDCGGPLKHCQSCRRPAVTDEVYAFIKPHARVDYCHKTPGDEKQCDQFGCKVVSQGKQCSAIHSEHCKTYVCQRCQQIVRIRGKYIDILKESKKRAKGGPVVINHTDCSEILFALAAIPFILLKVWTLSVTRATAALCRPLRSQTRGGPHAQ